MKIGKIGNLLWKTIRINFITSSNEKWKQQSLCACFDKDEELKMVSIKWGIITEENIPISYTNIMLYHGNSYVYDLLNTAIIYM